MNSYQSLLTVCLLFICSSLYGQDHTHQHETEATLDAHTHHQEETANSPEVSPQDHETMHSMPSESMKLMETQESALRDPHAYSNGYVRDSGPYTLAPQDQLSLADETYFAGLWVDRLEYVESHDTDATEFEGHAWIGDSYNRFLLRSEIEIVNDSLEVAEIDLLHTRAISPFWDVRFGARHEIRDEGNRNWASIGLGGLAPYWFEIDASLFISDNGNTLLDIEAEYDLLLTQRLVMQPRLDVHAYGKTDEMMRQGAGLSTVKAGFRIRYEFDRQLAPYFGIEQVMRYGKTADLLLPGEDRSDTHWIAGFKFWF